MIRSNFSTTGFDVGNNDVNMTYAYGLGDFFSTMFEDTSVPNLLLESDTLVASEIYSRFLQLTSGMSLEDVQASIGCQLRLALISSNDLQEGTLSTYKLPFAAVSSRYVANRPLAPTELLETGVDFSIFQDDSGSCYIRFARVLDQDPLLSQPYYAFSSRLLQDGSTQYAIWLVDAHIDEKLIYSAFGQLIGTKEENSSEAFANFVYGLYYVYTQGPSLTTVRRGLNLVLGIPLARLQEEVVDIRMYLQTDQYMVVTDQNQYLIPYGLPPSVSVGDTLMVGQELAQWVEVKDYTNDGEWWINLYIPSTIVPEAPAGDISRYAIAGSQLDYIMRNYLKTHTFLVRINVATFKNIQTFAELFKVIKQSKPAYAQPLYVWAVLNEEVVGAEDTLARIDINHFQEDDIGAAYGHMKRSASKPLSRGFARFIRFNSPASVSSVLGEETFINSSNNTVQSLAISGYSNPQAVLRGNSWEELDWMSVLANRSSDTWRGRRDQVGYRRGNLVSEIDPVRDDQMDYLLQGDWSTAVSDPVNSHKIGSVHSYFRENELHRTVSLSDVFHELQAGSRIVPLSVQSAEEIRAKLETIGIPTPITSRLTVPVYSGTRAVNTKAIHHPLLDNIVNEVLVDSIPSPLDFAVFLGTRYINLAVEDPVQDILPETLGSMNKSMCPSMFYQGAGSLTAVAEGDLVLVCPINCDLIAVYLVTQDAQSALPSSLPVENPIETVSATAVGTINRGMALHNSPAYFRRGSLALVDSTPEDPLEDPSTELANFLHSQGVPESSRVVPLTVISGVEAEDKAAFWGSGPLAATARYSLLPHPYPYRVKAESALKRSNAFVALSPSLNSLYQDYGMAVPVTEMEQPVGRLEDRYGFGAFAWQDIASSRPVVRSRYNLLRFTQFEGARQSSGLGDPGSAPTDWSFLTAGEDAYLSQYSRSTIRVEATDSAMVLAQSVALPPSTSAKFHLVIALNPSLLPLEELLEVKVLSGTCLVTYTVDGLTVDAGTYLPERNTAVIAVVENTQATQASLSLRFGLGVAASQSSGLVTGVAAFRWPDYRYVLGQEGLPPYQRVGDPVAGTSEVSGVPDYETEGFPPYLSFDGVDDYLNVSAVPGLGSEKMTVFASIMRPAGSDAGTPFELLSGVDLGQVTILTQENGGQFLTEDELSSLVLERSVKYSMTTGVSLVSVIELLTEQVLAYSYDDSSTPLYGTYSAVLDMAADSLGSRQMTLYKDGVQASVTTINPGPSPYFEFTDTRVTIGASGTETSFFNGNLFGLVITGTAMRVDEREAVENWVNKELTSYAYKPNSGLYHYPDFFHRDSPAPEAGPLNLHSLYEFAPSIDEVDMDWGYDSILLYRLNRNAVGLYWVTNRNTGAPTDYWTPVYSGVPYMLRISSGIPEQQGLTVIDPFRQDPSLNYDYLSKAVNMLGVDGLLSSYSAVFSYSDSYNTSLPVTRNGMVIRQPLAIQ